MMCHQMVWKIVGFNRGFSPEKWLMVSVSCKEEILKFTYGGPSSEDVYSKHQRKFFKKVSIKTRNKGF